MSVPLGLLAIAGGILVCWFVLIGKAFPWEQTSTATATQTSQGATNATQQGTPHRTSGSGGGGVSGVESQPVNLSPLVQAYFPL